MRDEQPDLARWVESTLGGSIESATRMGRWRVQWLLDVQTDDGVKHVMVRMPRDPEWVRLSAFTDHYDTKHEYEVLRALEPTSIPTPVAYGFHEPTESILMERVAGTGDFAALTDDAQRAAVLDEYIEHLVTLHSQPIDLFVARGIVPGANDRRSGAQLGWMRRDYERARPSMRPEPLLDFSLWWLDTHVDEGRASRTIVQGDTGPGQFLFDGSRVTALIDWELADIDDPMLDLGVMRMRNVLYPMGSVEASLRRYAELTGRPLDLRAVRYFTVLASLVSPLGMAQSMQNPTAKIDSMFPRFAWDASMRRCLCEALLEANGWEPDPPVLPPVAPTARTTLHDFLLEHLKVTRSVVVRDEYYGYLVNGAAGLAGALRLLDMIGPRLDEDDLDDAATVLGHRPADRDALDGALARLVAEAPDTKGRELVWLWHRMAVRRETALAPLMVMQGSGPLTPLPEDLGQ